MVNMDEVLPDPGNKKTKCRKLKKLLLLLDPPLLVPWYFFLFYLCSPNREFLVQKQLNLDRELHSLYSFVYKLGWVTSCFILFSKMGMTFFLNSEVQMR